MKVAKEKYTRVEYWDLEKEIKERYGIEVELVAAEEWRNDTAHPYWRVDGELDDYDTKELDKILSGEKQPSFGATRLFLWALVRDGNIEPGHYMVNISW